MSRKLFGTAAILAGGKSSRMGFDKTRLSINGEKWLDRLIGQLPSEFDQVLVITNRQDKDFESKAELVPDVFPGMGPLGGIHAALSQAKSKYVYIVSGDMFGINQNYARYMMEKLTEAQKKSILSEHCTMVETGRVAANSEEAEKSVPEICVTRIDDWIEPLNSFYAADLAPEMEKLLSANNTYLLDFIHSKNCLYIPEKEARQFSPDWAMFDNINSEEDLSRYLKLKGLDMGAVRV